MSTSDEIILEKREFITYEPGVFKARVEKLEKVTGKYGDQIKFWFLLLDAEDPAAMVVGWASALYTEKSKLFRWARALLGDLFNPEDKYFYGSKLIGKIALINLELKTTTDGTEVNKVADVMPVQRTKLKMQPAPMSNAEIVTDLGYSENTTQSATAQSVAVVSVASTAEKQEQLLLYPES